MTWIIKKIHIYSLFLAVVLLNAHMIIPHDHHQADSDICQEESSAVQGKMNSHHPVFPHHCHAFNNLTAEKAIAYIVIKLIPSTEMIPGRANNSDDPYIQSSLSGTTETSELWVSGCLQELSSLRAPPVTC
jgi:hypothetical protein